MRQSEIVCENRILFPLQFLFHALGHHSNFHDGRFELSARAAEPNSILDDGRSGGEATRFPTQAGICNVIDYKSSKNAAGGTCTFERSMFP